MSTVEALRNLAAVICGVDVKTVKGKSTAQIIQFIADNYPTDNSNDDNEGEE